MIHNDSFFNSVCSTKTTQRNDRQLYFLYLVIFNKNLLTFEVIMYQIGYYGAYSTMIKKCVIFDPLLIREDLIGKGVSCESAG